MIEAVVTTHEWPLVLVRSRVLVILQLKELGEGGRGADRLADQDVGDGRPLHRTVAREGEPRRLRDHVVWVAHVGRVVQLRHGHVDTRALGDRRVGEEEARVAELEVLELGVELHAVEGAPGAVQVLPSLVTCTQLHYCTTLHISQLSQSDSTPRSQRTRRGPASPPRPSPSGRHPHPCPSPSQWIFPSFFAHCWLS